MEEKRWPGWGSVVLACRRHLSRAGAEGVVPSPASPGPWAEPSGSAEEGLRVLWAAPGPWIRAPSPLSPAELTPAPPRCSRANSTGSITQGGSRLGPDCLGAGMGLLGDERRNPQACST